MNACMYECMYECMYGSMHVWIYEWMYVWMYECMYESMYECMNACSWWRWCWSSPSYKGSSKGPLWGHLEGHLFGWGPESFRLPDDSRTHLILNWWYWGSTWGSGGVSEATLGRKAGFVSFCLGMVWMIFGWRNRVGIELGVLEKGCSSELANLQISSLAP